MRTSLSLIDALFGKKVTVEVPDGRGGRRQITVTEKWLEKMVALKREEADALGSPTGVKYDALLEDYEPGATVEQIQAAFDETVRRGYLLWSRKIEFGRES